ncbi:MAG: hypothetical protein LBR34_09370 [Prevotella sp.]|jgi:hypothetical protein|nr:hypothetical protein [Prevotella sp.]
MTKLIHSAWFKPVSVLMAIVMLVTVPFHAGASTNERVILNAGTLVPLELLSTISSSNASSGNVIDFRVLNNVAVNGKTVIQAGSIAKGQITKIKKSGLFGQEGALEINVRSVTAVDGTNVYLSAANLSNEGDNKLALSLIVCLLCLFGFLIKGGNAEIPAGTTCYATVGSNVEINVQN